MGRRPNDEAVHAWARLHRASHRLLERAEGALKQAGLPPPAWYDVLHALAESGQEGLRPYELQDALLLAQYNASRLLTRLQREGLIERLPHPSDGRGQVVRITRRGLALRRRMWVVYGGVIASDFENLLSSAQCVALRDLLDPLTGR